MTGRQPETPWRGAELKLGFPDRIACRAPIKIIRALTTCVRPDPATDEITETDRTWSVSQKVSAERKSADKIAETGQPPP